MLEHVASIRKVCWGTLIYSTLLSAVLVADDPPLPAERPRVLDDGVSTAVFYLLDEQGNRVMMPGMSLEELERLQRLDEGLAVTGQPYSFQSVSIEGKAEERRADLTVRVRLMIDTDAKRLIRVPLRMGNFHLIAPPDISGVEEARVDRAPDGDGHVLLLRSDRRREVELALRMVGAIETNSRSVLQFQLPSSPTTVLLDVGEEDLTAVTEGRGDEVVRTVSRDPAGSRLVVESSGSDFRLAWGPGTPIDRSTPVLEAKSRWAIRWLSNEDKPTASVDLTVTNLRGDLAPFAIEFPAEIQILESLGAEFVPAGEATVLNGGQRWRVIPANAVVSDEIKLQFEMEFTEQIADSQRPLVIRGVHVVDAISQGGELEIRGDEEYRLRWLRRSWVRFLPTETRSATEASSYRFRFDRVPFELPVWLAARQRRLQINPRFDIRIRKSLAEIDGVIRVSGSNMDGRSLRLDMQGWRLQSITNQDNGEAIESLADGAIEEVDLSTAQRGSGEELRLKLVAVRAIVSDDQFLELPLPQLLPDDENLFLQPGVVAVETEPGLSLVVDLPRSEHIDPLPSADDEPRRPAFRFELQAGAANARLVGYLEEERPRLTLRSTAEITVEDGFLLAQTDWQLRSVRGLSGRIPLHGNLSEEWQRWTVTVDEQPAILRRDAEGSVELISSELRGEQHRVSFRKRLPLDAQMPLPTVLDISLPRPGVSELTTLGEVPVLLIPGGGLELHAEVAGRSVSELTLDGLPSKPLRVRLRSPVERQRELILRRVYLTTQVGRQARYERMLASVRGAGDLQIPLRGEVGNLTVELKIDDELQAAIQNADGSLSIPLAADRQEHLIDLQLWYNRPSATLSSTIRPAIQLPVGSGQVFWNVLLPEDQHAIWASPVLGRSMQWRFDRWRLRRFPRSDEATLAQWAGGPARSTVVSGNRFLYVGNDVVSLQVVTIARVGLWAIVGSSILTISALLVYLPGLRHPFALILAAVALAGLTLMAPDAAVIAGQLTLLALALVAMMLGVRAALQSRPQERLLDSSKPGVQKGSTHSIVMNREQESRLGSTKTQAMPVTAGDSP